MTRARFALPLSIGMFSTLALAQDVPAPPTAGTPVEHNRVAVVVGLSNYANLPKEVHLDFARSDAATVAQALKDQAHFTHVFLLRDGEASRENLRDTLRTKTAQLVGPNDTFVLYFVGHGIGGDLEIPTFLTYDSTMANGQQDGLELQGFARDVQTWTRAGTTLIVTDAIHRNQLDGIYFYGPAANQWPSMPPGTMILSSSEASRPAKDGVFGPVFAQAMGGLADIDKNGTLTAAELTTHLQEKLSPLGQVPVTAGDYDPNMPLALNLATAPAKPDAPALQWPDTLVTAAKFVWLDGMSQEVQCREQPIQPCAGSCYVRQFKVGPCTLSATYDGARLTGEAIILKEGRYDCGRKGDKIVCAAP
jgi:hypothetical protein